MSDINESQKFWKNVKPIFGNKVKGNKTITLIETNKVKNLLKLLMNILLILFQASVSLLFTRIMMM